MRSTVVSAADCSSFSEICCGQIYLHREDNGFHSGAFQRSSLKLMVNYARIFVLCASLARIQKLQPANSESEMTDQNVLNLWQSLITTIMDQLAFLINWPSYRCQLPWAPTYPALTIAFVSKSGLDWVSTLYNLLNYCQLHSHFESHVGDQNGLIKTCF